MNGGPGDGLDALDGAEPPGPAPTLDGAAEVLAQPPALGEAAAAAVDPVARGGAKKRKSGAAYRKEARARLQGRPPKPPRVTAAPPTPPAPPRERTAAEIDAEGLALARQIIEDPGTLEFIEGMYRMPFSLWSAAVKVPAVIPTQERLARAARLIVKAIQLFGVKQWMKYAPLVFLLIAVGEDVALGVKAMQDAKKASSGRTPAQEAAVEAAKAKQLAGPGASAQPGGGASGGLPPGDPA